MGAKANAAVIIALLIGSFGLGLAYYTFVSQESPNGMPSSSNPLIGILSPSSESAVSGNVSVRALVFATTSYAITVLCNGTPIGTQLPLNWNTTTFTDGWYNLTVIVTDAASKSARDQILVQVLNIPPLEPQTFGIDSFILGPWWLPPENTMIFDLETMILPECVVHIEHGMEVEWGPNTTRLEVEIRFYEGAMQRWVIPYNITRTEPPNTTAPLIIIEACDRIPFYFDRILIHWEVFPNNVDGWSWMQNNTWIVVHVYPTIQTWAYL